MSRRMKQRVHIYGPVIHCNLVHGNHIARAQVERGEHDRGADNRQRPVMPRWYD